MGTKMGRSYSPKIRGMRTELRTSLVVQWLENLPADAGDTGSNPGPGRSHMLQSN